MRFPSLFLALLVLSLLPIQGAMAHPEHSSIEEKGALLDTTQLPETMVILGRAHDLTGLGLAASQGFVGPEIIGLRPMLRVGELLETVPGMIVTQHSGTGKGNQMFLRGFNLDHGTDFRTELDGMPVNLPTNAHGQGYTDMNFVIPELVEHIEFQKGAYDASVGDFAGAGSARLALRRALERDFVRAELGEFGHRRAVAGFSRETGPGTLLLAGEIHNYDGPWDLPEDVDKVNGLARYTWTTEDRNQEFSVLALHYDNNWDSSDQVPQRAIDSGMIGRFGNLDASDGGSASRSSLSATWRRGGENDGQKINLYGFRSEMQLFSNFTFLQGDPVNGDQFEQIEERTVLGIEAEHRTPLSAFGRESTLRLGLQSRSDLIDDVGLHLTRERQRLSTVRSDDVFQTLNGAFVDLATPWNDRLRTRLGARVDHYHFDVTSDMEANSGTADSALLSPRGSLAYLLGEDTELYLNGGFGFHSNDARGTTISIDPASGEPADPVDPLVRTLGGEVGLRAHPLPGLTSTVSLWYLQLDSELLYVGDAGATEASDGSRRYGIEITNFWELMPGLTADLDLSLSEARFEDLPEGVDLIPGALERVISGGLTYRSASGPFCALRLRHLGPYPLIEDDSLRAESTTLVNAGVGVQLGSVEVALELINALDTEANDIQYAYASRLEGDPADGVEDIHVHPVEPRSIRGRMVWWF